MQMPAASAPVINQCDAHGSGSGGAPQLVSNQYSGTELYHTDIREQSAYLRRRKRLRPERRIGSGYDRTGEEEGMDQARRREDSVATVVGLDDMLTEILVRVPVKSVFSFKCVSKRWLGLISDPSFSRAYVSIRDGSHAPPWTLLYQYPPSRFNRSIPSLEEKLTRTAFSDDTSPGFSIFSPTTNDFILACSDGLLLCRSNEGYRIRNPVTGECFRLPPPPRRFGLRVEGFATRKDGGGVVSSYRVVFMELVSERKNEFQCDVYCSEKGWWTRFRVRSEKTVRLLAYSPRLFNGTLLWFDDELRMVGYDPYGKPEAFHLIPLPRFREGGQWGGLDALLCLCDVSQGELRFFHIDDDGDFSLRVWKLIDYGRGEWNLEQKIMLNGLLQVQDCSSSKGMHAIPLASHPLDSAVVFLWCFRGIVACNIRTGIFEDHYPGSGKSILHGSSVCKFVLLWPSPIPIASVENREMADLWMKRKD